MTFKGLKEILHVYTVLDPQQNLGRKIKRGNVGDALPGWKMIVQVTSNKRVGISEGEHGNIRASLATYNIFYELRCNVRVAFCHPLSHLKRRAIKADPTNGRTDNTCRIEICRKFPLWNGRRTTLKTLGRGLKEKENGQIKMEEVAPGMAVLSLKKLRGKLTPFQNCHPRAGKGKRTHKTSGN